MTKQTIYAVELPEPGHQLAGGAFIARYWLNGQEQALIALGADAEFSGEYGEYGVVIEGASSYSDGLANTKAMAEAGSEIAKKALEADAFIPSCLEAALLMTAKQNGLITDLREDDWYWLSSQFSADGAYFMDFEGGWLDTGYKFSERVVRPVRSLLIQ